MRRLCVPASVKNETPEPMPLCTVVTAGCDGLEPPQFSDQVAGSDVFGACNDEL